MLVVFFMMIILNAFLFTLQLKSMSISEQESSLKRTTKVEIIAGLHLVVYVIALVLYMIDYYQLALLGMVFPVLVAGVSEVVFSWLPGVFKLRQRKSIFAQRHRKIIFELTASDFE